MENTADNIEVAIRERCAYVRVHGRGTFKMGPSLKEFGMAAVDRGCSKIVLVMSDCSGMDSTFMGTLAGLAVQIGKSGGEIVLQNASEKNKHLITMLGLASLVKFDDESAVCGAMPTVVETLAVQSGKQKLTEAMIEAHETLIDVAPENIVKFKDVLSFLREDLKGVSGKKGEGQLAS
jgi:anti-sigma B factor antagonist